MDDALVRTQLHITYAAAEEALRAAIRKAEEIGVRVGICITDANGNIVAAARMEGATARAIEGAQKKAVFSASMGRSTEEFIETRLKKDEVLWRAMSANPNVFIVPGGFPMLYRGTPVGGVGVSGAKHEQDAVVARAAADHFAAVAERAAPAAASGS